MVVVGLVSLLMATLEHRRALNALRAEFQDIPTPIIGPGASYIDFASGNSGLSYRCSDGAMQACDLQRIYKLGQP